MKFDLLFCFLSLFFFVSCHNHKIKVPASPYPVSQDSYSIDTIAKGFAIPYGLAVVSDDEYFISDRIGKMFHYKNGNLSEISGTPEVISFGIPGIPAILHGGLMDVSLHPDYVSNHWIYIAYLASDGFATVARITIQDHTASVIDTIFTTRRENFTGNGMRIVWEDATHFFLNVGNSDFSTKENPVLYAQNLSDDAGKIHRLMDDGTIPADNPVFDSITGPTTIWSYGHRDVQGLYFEKSTHTLFGVEHGPKGGDEFNVIEKGKNYGWPLFTYGINYDGAGVSLITEDSATISTVLPEHYWTIPTRDGGQALAPACLVKVIDSNIEDWNDHFLFGSLAYRRLMKYNRTTAETFGLPIEGRVRTIQQLPGGDILAMIERNDLKKLNGMIIRIKK